MWNLILRGGFSYGLVLVAQLLSAAAGLLFVNFLTKEEFALFTVCTALMQAIVAQSDLGTLAAVGYFYRKYSGWAGFKKDSLPAIAGLRSKFFLLAGIALISFFVVSNSSQGASVTRTSVLLGLTFGAAWFGMVNSLQTMTLRVRGDVNESVGIDATANFVRFALAFGVFSLGIMSADAALTTSLLSAIVPFLIGRMYFREIPLGLSPWHNKVEQRKVLQYVWPLIPGSLYFTLQPSILIWLSAIFGNTQQVAEVGAISRIGQIIAFVGFGLELFILPHLANLRDERAFRHSYVRICFILLGVAFTVFLAITASRSYILLLLGSKYSSLDNEVILVAGASILSVVANYAVLVNRIKGWNRVEPLSTIVLFAGQAILIALLPLDSTADILVLGLLYALLCVFVTFGINVIGFIRPAWAVIS